MTGETRQCLLIDNALVVNEGRCVRGGVLLEGETILQVFAGDYDAHRMPNCHVAQHIDAEGAYLFPGVIDEHVHFREPGLTQKADIATESFSAAAGGVTSYFEMPNTIPTTTTMEAYDTKMKIASEKSLVNYSFFFGATNNNADVLPLLDKHRVCGVKVFMGASTGDMLVDDESSLHKIFANSQLPIMAHCEYSPLIARYMADCKEKYNTDDPDISLHPIIRSEEACYRSSRLAVELARKTGAKLHVAHITTGRELFLFSPGDKQVIGEVCLPHLLFDNTDYSRLGTLIKCNPAIKTKRDREALRDALTNGRIYTVGTDHAPHLLSDKEGGAAKAASGMPTIQFSLISMLDLSEQGVLPVERIVELMCHNPANFYNIEKRGYIRVGYKADLVIVSKVPEYVIKNTDVVSKCGWTPLDGRKSMHKVMITICNGTVVYDHGKFSKPEYRGQALTFER